MENKSSFSFTVKRPVAITMIVLGIVVFGYVSYTQLSWNLMPDISYPTYTIRTEYPGSAPEEVENVVSRPLEEQLSLIKNLNSIVSVSRSGQSDITLEFAWDTNMDRAAQEIREKLDQVHLDKYVKKPLILRYDPSLDPILRLAVVSSLPPLELRQIIEEEVARELEAIPGVAAARVKGGLEKEILVKLDEKQLAVNKITFNEINNRLKEENVNLSGGNIKEGETEYIIRTLNEFKSISEIGEIIISKKNNINIKLKDIAQIEYSHKERTVITGINQKESIEIDIFKEADANIIKVAKLVKEKLMGTEAQRAYVAKKRNNKLKSKEKPKNRRGSFARLKQERKMTGFIKNRLPEGIDFHIVADQSIFIENSIKEVKNTAVLGGIFAILILYLFLKNINTTLIVALSIPISIVATFAPLKMFGISMNIMSLGGLALGIGMLVDSSIVVMESIFRCREEGDDFINSAIRGVSEVGGAVIASTLTTIAVFFPIVFVEGIAGQIFKDLSLSVVFSLLASLLVSLFFIPMLASREKKKININHSSVRFSFEKKHSPINYLLLIPQGLLMSLKVITGYILTFIFTIITLILALMEPLLSLFKIKYHHNFIKKTERILNKYLIQLWDDHNKIIPYQDFISSFIKGKMRYIFPFIYILFKLYIRSFIFLIGRMFITFISCLIISIKMIFMILALPLSIVVKLISKVFNKILDYINNIYPKFLSWALNKENLLITSVLIVFFCTIFIILPNLNSELIPEVHRGSIYINITLPVGTPVEKTDRVVQDISKKIKKLPNIKSIGYYAGTTKDDVNTKEIGENIAKITITLKKSNNIKRDEAKLIKEIRDLMSNITDIDYNISRPVLFSAKIPVELVIKGYDIDELRNYSLKLTEKIKKIPGLKDIESSSKTGFPELVIRFNRSKLSHYGLNAGNVAQLIKNKVEGNIATQYKERDRKIDIRVFLKDNQRKNVGNIKNLIINPGSDIPIPLNAVAELKIISGPNEIRRVNQERSVIITANLDGISLNQAIEKISEVLESTINTNSLHYEFAGQSKEMDSSNRSLILAISLAIFLVYIVMASQFESFLHPFLILFSIPMAIIGVIITLYVLQIPLGITVGIGLITLIGIVVNNAIVLTDYINTLRARGVDKVSAIKEAGMVRLRPILITTMTTVLGLLPMALGLGEGAEIRTPMAITIIAGLLSSTFLTLILIPVVYKRFSK